MVNNARAVGSSVAIIAVALMAAACVVRHYHKSQATALMERYLLVPEGRFLATFPQGMPGNGHSGRATNVEDFADPYGGGDVPGPYGRVNDPYDGDWALAPLGGKAINVQGLHAVNPAEAAKDQNIWGAKDMGTNSIFMGNMPASEAYDKRRINRRQMGPPPNMMPNKRAADANKQPLSFVPDADWVGTNAAFMGANGGGYGLARGKKMGLAHKATAKKAAPAASHQQTVMRAQMQTLFRSDDPHEAEYGREGEHQLDASVLPSDIGSGGPVMGVDGKPSNMAHAWVHVDEPFSFACNPDISGCEKGLTVDPLYAHD
jgi:hypothetical protein